MIEAKTYKSYSLNNFKAAPQVSKFLSDEVKHSIEVVGNVLPFKVNNYVMEELINWTNIPEDPIFQLTFPQKEMLSKDHFNKVEQALKQNLPRQELQKIVNVIRRQLNPHPDGQKGNVPTLKGQPLRGIQHKYQETLLFFPRNGQTCHAYCTFCFRWTQFVGMDTFKFAMKETELLVEYLREHPEITDVLFTGGDPMVMSSKNFASYIEPLLEANLPNLQTIRIGTKSLSYWPYRFITDEDADDMLSIFKKIVERGYHLAFMAHLNHPVELKTKAVKKAIERIQGTGAVIRTQSPIMKHINDNASTWRDLWKKQVKLGCVPYYMFIARDTGAQDYFAIELEKAWKIFRKAFRQVSGIARTVRGPSMSTDVGKVHILGINKIKGEEVFSLRFLQGRNPDWVGEPFFAKYDENAIWLDDLEPTGEEESFFFEEEMELSLPNGFGY